jgi:hypothetical protein
MPQTAINYQKSVIYKIEHLENPALLYVGSTTDFIKRKNNHKSCCTNENKSKYNINLYKMIRDNGGWNSFKIMIIKEYPCLNKIELLIEEDRLIKELKSSLNEIKAYRTEEEKIKQKKECDEEYRKANKDYLLVQNKDYYKANKEKIKDYKSKKYECECGCQININNKYNHIKTFKHLNKLK